MKPLSKKTIGFVGAGNMAGALIKGLITSNLITPLQIIASDRDKKKLVGIAEKYGIKVFNENFEVAEAADIIILAVKPDDMTAALEEIAPGVTKEKLLISIVAGKTTGAILDSLSAAGMRHKVAVVRAMPNMPALVGEGATAVFAAEGKAAKIVDAIFGAVGTVVKVNEETLLDAVTGLSGSGPAYIFLFMEALVEAGVNLGIPVEDAKKLVFKTALGAARVAWESKKDMAELIKTITSPGGTTIEGLKEFEKAGLKKIVSSAVFAAAKRAKELSGAG
ncbi:MAG TPA: pyrroline-5-carboxylate reductase [Thermodesulfobacteriota bacterium]|nr:pyrroline-5-carboxylate reductase [Thermodesulfobacteriota bacterium]